MRCISRIEHQSNKCNSIGTHIWEGYTPTQPQSIGNILSLYNEMQFTNGIPNDWGLFHWKSFTNGIPMEWVPFHWNLFVCIGQPSQWLEVVYGAKIALWNTKLCFHVHIEHSNWKSHCYQHCARKLTSLSALAWLRRYHKCGIVWGDHMASLRS